MADARRDSGSKHGDPDSGAGKRRKGKVPSKTKYDEEMEALMRQIKEKEAQLNSITVVRPDATSDQDVGASASRESLLADLRKLKGDKESVHDDRRKIDQELQQLNANIQKKRDTLTKLQSALKFKTETQVDDAIKKLEQQVQTQTQRLSLSEEKRIVSEISALKASKRNIQEYVAAREQIDAERARQNKLRDEREEFFKRLSEIRQSEDAIKSHLDGLKGKQDEAWTEFKQRAAEKDAVRKEIDSLYGRKKELFAQNKKEMDAHFDSIRAQKKARREEEVKRKEEDRRTTQQAHQKEMTEYMKMREPHKAERDLCSALISYLAPLAAGTTSGDREVTAARSSDMDTLAPVRSDEMTSPQGTFRRKKDDEMGYFSGTGKGKKGKKGKRAAVAQKGPRQLNHNPTIFGQFMSLHLRAPNTSAEVQGVIQQLIDKRSYLERLAAEEKEALLSQGKEVGTTGEEGAGQQLNEEEQEDNQHLERGKESEQVKDDEVEPQEVEEESHVPLGIEDTEGEQHGEDDVNVDQDKETEKTAELRSDEDDESQDQAEEEMRQEKQKENEDRQQGEAGEHEQVEEEKTNENQVDEHSQAGDTEEGEQPEQDVEKQEIPDVVESTTDQQQVVGNMEFEEMAEGSVPESEREEGEQQEKNIEIMKESDIVELHEDEEQDVSLKMELDKVDEGLVLESGGEEGEQQEQDVESKKTLELVEELHEGEQQDTSDEMKLEEVAAVSKVDDTVEMIQQEGSLTGQHVTVEEKSDCSVVVPSESTDPIDELACKENTEDSSRGSGDQELSSDSNTKEENYMEVEDGGVADNPKPQLVVQTSEEERLIDNSQEGESAQNKNGVQASDERQIDEEDQAKDNIEVSTVDESVLESVDTEQSVSKDQDVDSSKHEDETAGVPLQGDDIVKTSNIVQVTTIDSSQRDEGVDSKEFDLPVRAVQNGQVVVPTEQRIETTDHDAPVQPDPLVYQATDGVESFAASDLTETVKAVMGEEDSDDESGTEV